MSNVETQIHELHGIKIAEVVGDEVLVRSGQDVLDLVGQLYGTETHHLILWEEQLDPRFFDLRTGVAGDILQKFVNYHLTVAIVGQFDRYQSQALHSLMLESNKGNDLFFTSTVSEAIERLATTGEAR